jgi:hypothetical protein
MRTGVLQLRMRVRATASNALRFLDWTGSCVKQPFGKALLNFAVFQYRGAFEFHHLMKRHYGAV